MPRYIDADALNAAIEDWFDGVCVYDVSPSEAVNDFQSIVDEQHTISPDEVRGAGEREDAKQHGLCRCSVCKDCYIERDYITQAKWCYCPNCGARLEVSVDA